MADEIGASPLSIIAALMGAVNQNRQKQPQQSAGFTPGGGPGAYGSNAPSYTPGGEGYGLYEGNIKTPANPMGGLTPNLGAANPPAMQRPAPIANPPMPQGRPFGAGASPVPFTQMPMANATAPQPVQGSPSLPYSSTFPSPTPFMPQQSQPMASWASPYLPKQQSNPMMSALFSAPEMYSNMAPGML